LIAEHVPPQRYFGVDINPRVLSIASERFPRHQFSTNLPEGSFDTVVALAVIEHIPEPVRDSVVDWIEPLRSDGKLVLTTPHKAFRRVHEAGAAMGLASQSAAEEHETLFDRNSLVEALDTLPLVLETYRRFLFGMNQLFVFRKL
jgi:SAM-dependent methyltransferase